MEAKLQDTIDLPQTAKKLIYQKQQGAITQQELEFECAHWALPHTKRSIPKPLPTPPEEYIDFRRETPYEQRKGSDKFYAQEFICNYLDQKEKVLTHNRSDLFHLYKFEAILREGGDNTNADLLKEKITEYKSWFHTNGQGIEWAENIYHIAKRKPVEV